MVEVTREEATHIHDLKTLEEVIIVMLEIQIAIIIIAETVTQHAQLEIAILETMVQIETEPIEIIPILEITPTIERPHKTDHVLILDRLILPRVLLVRIEVQEAQDRLALEVLVDRLDLLVVAEADQGEVAVEVNFQKKLRNIY
jgi:hypothetical protein